MSNDATTKEAQDRSAIRVHHARPAIAGLLGAITAVTYWMVGDTLYLLVGAIVAYFVHIGLLMNHSARHTAMQHCPRCTKLASQHPINRFLTWYFHRRILDGKAVLLIVAAGIMISTLFVAYGKPHALLPFFLTYELFIAHFALMFRCLVVHRGNEATCQLCKSGDHPHPLGRIDASELGGK